MAAAIPIMLIAQAGISMLQGAGQSGALKAQDRLQRSQSRINQRFLHLQADDSIKRGDEDATQVRRAGARDRLDAVGEQRAGFAGQGVDVNSGSAALVQDQTVSESQFASEMDALTIKNNAWREAWGYRVEADNVGAESRMRSIGSKFQRRQTLLTGGMQAGSSLGQAAFFSRGRK